MIINIGLNNSLLHPSPYPLIGNVYKYSDLEDNQIVFTMPHYNPLCEYRWEFDIYGYAECINIESFGDNAFKLTYDIPRLV